MSNFEFGEGEKLVTQVPANLFRGREAVGGQLSVTSERLRFKPHVLNVQSEVEEILLDDIVDVGKRNTLFVIPNGMRITTFLGRDYHFVVGKRTGLIELIRNAIALRKIPS